ncbi:MAG: hypothetical protein FJ267_06830 [Planctomycetes bacterium]|nr:hypothetical protein [Planctomycetota bacterium]
MEFEKFQNPIQWWLRKGEPSWLEGASMFQRAVRLSVVLGILGSLSGWLTAIFAFAAIALGPLFLTMPFIPVGPILTWLAICIGPGFFFGLGVLVPLSRWKGIQGWEWDTGSIGVSSVVSVIANYAFAMSMFEDDRTSSFIFANFLGAPFLLMSMNDLRNWISWLAVPVTVTLVSVISGFTLPLQSFGNSPLSLLVPGEIGLFVGTGLLYSSFQCIVAIGLGVQLWWPEEAKIVKSTSLECSVE